MLDEYVRCNTELIKCEYDKQKLIKEGYTPEQEKKYLDGLKRDMKATVDNFEKLYKFSEQYGDKFLEGKLLNNDLDHITGVQGKNTRNSGFAIGHIKGQMQAIDNGWGMEELVPLGALGELKYRLEEDYRKGDYEIKIQDDSIKGDLRRIEKAKNEKNEEREKRFREAYAGHIVSKEYEIRKKEQSKALLDDLKELDDTVMNQKVRNTADKLEVINTILDFAEKKGKIYSDTKINMVFGTELKTLLNETREKVINDLHMDKAIKGLEDGQKGTFFGKDDYDKVLKDLKALDNMYKQNKEAFLAMDKSAYTPEMKAKEAEVLAGMEAYQRRKEEEFKNNEAAGKEDNANSRRRYNAMKQAMNDLRVRMDYNERIESRFAPIAEAPKAEEPVLDDLIAKAPDAAPGNRPVINEETVKYLHALKSSATTARGLLNDSDQYLSFCAAIDNITNVTQSILDSRQKGNITDENTEYEQYKKAVRILKMAAKDYEDYKLSDHTEEEKTQFR